MSKHTPGPWRVENITKEKGFTHYVPWGRVYRGVGRGGIDANLPDACLIAAAPDLLAACEEAVPVAPPRVQKLLRAAIAKARGES